MKINLVEPSISKRMDRRTDRQTWRS